MVKVTHAVLPPRRAAERRKERGNELYRARQYACAVRLYSEAIELCPDSAQYYLNRCAGNMMLGRFCKALTDAKQCVKLEPENVKAHVRAAKCRLALGDVRGAVTSIQRAREVNAAHTEVAPEARRIEQVRQLEDEATQAISRGDHGLALLTWECLLEHVKCERFKASRSECLALLGRYAEAEQAAEEVLVVDPNYELAQFVQALSVYGQGRASSAALLLRKMLRQSPDNVRAQKLFKKVSILDSKWKEGNVAYKAGRCKEAYKCYTEALVIDPDNRCCNATLLCNRAATCYELSRFFDCEIDCTSALALSPDMLKALIRRARARLALGERSAAAEDLRRAVSVHDSAEAARLLHEAEGPPDLYNVLGVCSGASASELRRSYRQKALEHHPDRHANESTLVRKAHERRFKDVGEAYAILSDPCKRAKYDQDQEEEYDDLFSDHDYGDTWSEYEYSAAYS